MKNLFNLLSSVLLCFFVSSCGFNNDEKPTNEEKSIYYPNYIIQNTHTGNENDPYTVKEILDNKITGENIYLYGKVTKIVDESLDYGYSFHLFSYDSTIICGSVMCFDGAKYPSLSYIKVNDELVLKSKIVDGKFDSGYLFSLNNKKETIKDDDNGDEEENLLKDIDKTAFGNYYSGFSTSYTAGLNGTLRTYLTSLIKPKDYYKYSGSSSGTLGKVLQEADEDPKNSNNMIMFYTQKSVTKDGAGNDTWNREHVWPQSLSNGLYGTSGGGADLLHIRPTFSTTNSARGSLLYGNVSGDNRLTYDGIQYGKKSGRLFEPLDSVKGDCARIVFYMRTTYFANNNTPISKVASSIDTMIEWSKLDPVDDIERNRNEYAQLSRQKNRNPFVDHPEWIDYIFKTA